FSFSKLRGEGAPISTVHGIACGPISVMKLYGAVGDTLTQGSFRLGAHMGQLRVDHPDIFEFIEAKKNGGLENFNISVQVTDDFMRRVADNETFDLINPKNNEIDKTVRAKDIWDLLCKSAWSTGDPGIVFMDRVLETQPNPQLGDIQTSNPCGEEFLENYGNCCLGSLNLAAYTSPYYLEGDESDPSWIGINFKLLRRDVVTAVRFLDDVIEVNTFPLDKQREVNLQTRRIGLGVMGWADMLAALKIPYSSNEAIALAKKLGYFIKDAAKSASHELAKERGSYPLQDPDEMYIQRHSSVTTIAPTGTISRIAGCSSGIEPYYALAWESNVLWDLDGARVKLIDAPSAVVKALEDSQANVQYVLQDMMAHPESASAILEEHTNKELSLSHLETAHEIDFVAHIEMQGAWQENTTNSVSKTINMSNEATVEEVSKAFR
ncbi:hypothetical protein LCGC14_2695620, partial [marine sediment metagenome]